MQIKKMHKDAAAAQAAAIDKTINAMLEKAIVRQATDIHLEPRERNIAVRFRIDGLLQEAAKLPLPALKGIASNLKTRANLNAEESRMPQSASFMFKSDQLDVSVQVATMPTVNGEKIAIHLNPQLSEPATLEALGFWGNMLQHIEYAVAEPHGLVLAASPYRVGTNLSLLGIVHLLNNPSLNIVTLEDPIEHRMAGITQSQVDIAAGLNFSNGFSALLKLDPNVVMVSDLHEPQAVRVALDAALSGHLILGGLHVNSAAQAVAHALHMGSEPYLVATALKVVAGQRFVRRLCPSCREVYEPDAASIKSIKQLLKACGISSMKRVHDLEQQAAAEGLGESAPSSLSTSATGVTHLWRAKIDGCPHCEFTGYHGRLGICEVLVNSDAMKKLITTTPPVTAIQKLALEEGMLPLQLDGLIKALRGLTSLEEIL